jgi:hypothetical protein
MRRILTVCLAVFTFACLATLARATDKPSQAPLTGTWQCQSHGGSQGDMSFTLDLQQNGEDVTGSVSSPLGNADIASGSFESNHLRIQINGADTAYILTADYQNGKLVGAWHTTDTAEKGTWEGKKQASN